MREMIPITQTRLYKWPAAAIAAIRKNPIDTGIAITLAAVFVGWAVGEAWYADKPLTAFADSWGDFGGSIIGGLVAFLLAKIALDKQAIAQKKEQAVRAAPYAEAALRAYEEWLAGAFVSLNLAHRAMTKIKRHPSDTELRLTSAIEMTWALKELKELDDIGTTAEAHIKSLLPDFEALYDHLQRQISELVETRKFAIEDLGSILVFEDDTSLSEMRRLAKACIFDDEALIVTAQMTGMIEESEEYLSNFFELHRGVISVLRAVSAGQIPELDASTKSLLLAVGY